MRAQAAELGFAVAYMLALAVPAFAGSHAEVAGLRATVGMLVAFAWFTWGFQPVDARERFGVARWPEFTALLFGSAALAVYVSHGRPGFVLWFAVWALPGIAVLARQHVGGLPADPTPVVVEEAEGYAPDVEWLAPDEPGDSSLDTAGYRLTLVGGPLAGRKARLRDSRFRLWVAGANGERRVRGAIERPGGLPEGSRLIGFYGFSHGDEAMVWSPTP